MKRFADISLAAGLLALGISGAQAADLRTPVVKAPPAPIAVPFSWTGFYVGANAGGIWGRSNYDAYDGALFPPFVKIDEGFPVVVLGLPGTLPAVSGSHTSWLAGGQVGYNWQIDKFLVGVEADAFATGLRMTGISTAARFPGSTVSQIVTAGHTTDIDWMATLRLRLGLTIDRVLLYVTGGGAVADIDVNSLVTVANGPAIILPAGTFASTSSSSRTRLGWTVGAGIEWAFADAWSVAAEYRHSDFGRVGNSFTIPDGFGGVFATGTTSARVTTDQATLRLNYRFAPTPVVARY